MARTVSVGLHAKGRRFAIAVGRFNDFITSRLLEAAIDTLKRHGADEDAITAVWAPGSFELPLVARKLAASGKHDAVIALGCLIRGQTPHFDHIASACARGLSDAALQTGVPVTFGVITADTLEQAVDRAGAKGGNKGAEAAAAAIEMANLMAALSDA